MDTEKLIELRVQGVKEASARARLAFFIMTFACATILITLYNNYFAWNRILLDESEGVSEWQFRGPMEGVHDPSPPAGLTGTDLENWTKRLDDYKKGRKDRVEVLAQEMRKQDARSLADNQGISISLLGIKLSSGDQDVFGAAALLFTSMYYLLCVRRMSLEIESLLKDASSLPSEMQHFVYVGVRQSYVLNSAADESRPSTPSEPALKLSNWIFQNMALLPTVMIALMVVSDWYYLFRASVPKAVWWWSHLAPAYRNQFALMDVFAIIAGAATLLVSLSTRRFQRQAVIQITSFWSSVLTKEVERSGKGSME